MSSSSEFTFEFFAIAFLGIVGFVVVWALRGLTRGAIRLIKSGLNRQNDPEIRKLRALEFLAWTYWLFGIGSIFVQPAAFPLLICGGITLTTITVIRGRQLKKHEHLRDALEWVTG